MKNSNPGKALNREALKSVKGGKGTSAIFCSSPHLYCSIWANDCSAGCKCKMVGLDFFCVPA